LTCLLLGGISLLRYLKAGTLPKVNLTDDGVSHLTSLVELRDITISDSDLVLGSGATAFCALRNLTSIDLSGQPGISTRAIQAMAGQTVAGGGGIF
jgi:hypothetical protein